MKTLKRSSAHNKVILILLLITLMVSLACGLPFQSENQEPTLEATENLESEITAVPSTTPEQPPADTPVPPATQSPTETPQAYPTVSADVLKEQLFHLTYYIGPDENICVESFPPEGTTLPAIVPEGRSDLYGSIETHTFCIYGYPFDQETYLTVYAPDGTFMGDGLLLVDSGDIENGVRLRNDETGNWGWVGEAMTIEATPTIQLRLWLPIGLQHGTWNMVLFAEGISIEQTFENPPSDRMAISTLPEGDIDLMPPYPCSVFGPGETVYIHGAGFMPNVALPMGVYADTDTGSSVLVDSLLVETDAAGEFSAWVKVKDFYPAGYHSIVPNEAVSDSSIENIDATGCFQVEGSTAELDPVDTGEGIWEPCIGLHVSQLHIGDHAIVNVESNLPNRVRSAPDRDYGEHIGSIGPGEMMWIIDGPECANGWVWWKISAEDLDLEGWTPEGDHFEYWLMPIP